MMQTDRKSAGQRVSAARWIFIVAALYGTPVFIYWFFRNPQIVRMASLQQPEIYYGFAGLGLAWQMVFLLIAHDPLRYRPLMLLAAIGEKFFFAGILAVLLIHHIARRHWIPAAGIDFSFGVLFIFAFWMTGPAREKS